MPRNSYQYQNEERAAMARTLNLLETELQAARIAQDEGRYQDAIGHLETTLEPLHGGVITAAILERISMLREVLA